MLLIRAEQVPEQEVHSVFILIQVTVVSPLAGIQPHNLLQMASLERISAQEMKGLA